MIIRVDDMRERPSLSILLAAAGLTVIGAGIWNVVAHTPARWSSNLVSPASTPTLSPEDAAENQNMLPVAVRTESPPGFRLTDLGHFRQNSNLGAVIYVGDGTPAGEAALVGKYTAHVRWSREPGGVRLFVEWTDAEGDLSRRAEYLVDASNTIIPVDLRETSSQREATRLIPWFVSAILAWIPGALLIWSARRCSTSRRATQ